MDFWPWVHECEGYQIPRNVADAFHLASHNANTIAFDITLTIAHPNISNHGKSGITIVELSLDDALATHFRFRKVHMQEVSDKLWPRLSCYLDGEQD